MKKYLLSKNKNTYKANLHAHTNISDGRLSPEELKELYKSNGYSVLAYTDHDIMIPHSELTDDTFVALTGFEVQFNGSDKYPGVPNEKKCHICFIAGKSDMVEQPCWREEYAYIGNSASYRDRVRFDKESTPFVRKYTPECINEMVSIAREKGFFITYNHPAWSLESYEQYMKYEGFHAIEVFNYATERLGYQSTATYAYDDMLRDGKRLFAVAADDVHAKDRDYFGGFVMIKAEALTYDLITEALFKGDFYASTGPELREIYVEDGKLYVSSSDAASICLTSDGRKAKFVHADRGNVIDRAVFPLDFEYRYLRITVKDLQGNYAYTNAFFAEDM